MADPSAAESTSILLVSTRRASRDEVAQILEGERADTRLFWVSQPELAVVRAQDLAAQIILVDDDLGGASPAALIQDLSSRIPDAAILALVDADAMGLAREALLAGARAFVTRPLKSNDISSALRQIIARPSPAVAESQTGRLGRLVVFCGSKGGTGRTTAAINTAISLRQVEDRPLALVDADYAAPAVDVQLNLHDQRSVVDLLPHIRQLDRELIESVLVDHPSGLRVLLAPPPADVTVHISLPQLEQILLWLKRMFPWVVVDLGLPIDELAFGFLDAADLVVMSANPEMVGLRNAQLMTAQFRARGYPEGKVWLLLNRAGLHGGLREEDVAQYLGLKVRHRIPNSQVAATDNVNRGVPFVLSSPRSPVSRAYQGLARELVRCLPLRTWSTTISEFAASAEAATAAELTTSASPPAPPARLTPEDGEPEDLFEVDAAAAQPEPQTSAPSAPAAELDVEPAVASAAAAEPEAQTLAPGAAVTQLDVEAAVAAAASTQLEPQTPEWSAPAAELDAEWAAMLAASAEPKGQPLAPTPVTDLDLEPEQAAPASAELETQAPAPPAPVTQLEVEPEQAAAYSTQLEAQTLAPRTPEAELDVVPAGAAASVVQSSPQLPALPAPAAELDMESAAAGAAIPAVGDHRRADQDLAGGPGNRAGITEGRKARALTSSDVVPARLDAPRQVTTGRRTLRLSTAREWAGLILALLAIFASLGALGFAVSRIVANQRRAAEVAQQNSLSPTPGLAETVAGSTPISTRQLAGIAAGGPTPSEVVASPTVSATFSVAELSASASAAVTPTASPQATATFTPTPVPSYTSTEAPTATATFTSTPEPSPTVALPTPTRTQRPTASPTASPTATVTPAVSAPRLMAPASGASQDGTALFEWQATSLLPAGTAYEVVWWNNGENPLDARGIAAPVMTASLAVNLNLLYNSGQLKSSDIFWTVLVVSTDPYTRLTQPDAASARLLVFQPGGQQSGEPPPKAR